MIKNAPQGALFLMKSGSGNEEIVKGAQITQGEGYANAQAFAGVAEKRVGWHFRKKMTEGAHFARFSPSTAKAVPLPFQREATISSKLGSLFKGSCQRS